MVSVTQVIFTPAEPQEKEGNLLESRMAKKTMEDDLPVKDRIMACTYSTLSVHRIVSTRNDWSQKTLS